MNQIHTNMRVYEMHRQDYPLVTAEEIASTKPGMFDTIVEAAAFLICCASLAAIGVVIACLFSQSLTSAVESLVKGLRQ